MIGPAIKICGITSSEALNACLRAEVDYVGLVFFAKSPRNVSIDQAAALAAEGRGKTKTVGLFVNPTDDFIDAVRAKVHLDVLQLHGSESPAQAAALRAQSGLEVWKALGIRKREDFAQARTYQEAVTRVLYDAKPPEGTYLPGGNGLCIDWSLFTGQQHPLPWILAGGLDAGNVADAIAQTGAQIVDTSSGVETAPGIKDADLIANFAAAVRQG